MTDPDRIAETNDLASRVERTMGQMLDAAKVLGIAVSPTGHVGETDACTLLGLGAGVLKNRRRVGTGPEFYRRSWRGARITYRLKALALWLEQGLADGSEWASTASDGIDVDDAAEQNRSNLRRRRP